MAGGPGKAIVGGGNQALVWIWSPQSSVEVPPSIVMGLWHVPTAWGWEGPSKSFAHRRRRRRHGPLSIFRLCPLRGGGTLHHDRLGVLVHECGCVSTTTVRLLCFFLVACWRRSPVLCVFSVLSVFCHVFLF